MKIQVENTYADGHQSSQVHTIEEPSTADLEELWEELWEYTGDGSGEHQNAYYEVTILESANPKLVGLTNEWC